MLKPIHNAAAAPLLTISVDGRPVAARGGVTLAVALLEAGVVPTRRTPVSGAPRAPLCLMGVCFDCIVELEGAQVQACMTQVRAGMRVRLPTGAREARARA